MRHSRSALPLMALSLAITLASCFGARRSTHGSARRGQPSEDALATLPTREALLQFRTPRPAEAPADLAMMHGATVLQSIRLAAARGELVSAPPNPQGDIEIAARSCLWADAMGDPAIVVRECSAFVDLAPADPRGVAAAALVARAAGEVSDGDRLFEARASRWLDDCAAQRGACFDLAAVLSDAILEAARTAGSRERLREAAQRVGRLLDADAAGPYRGDELVSFADPALAVPLIDDPPYTRTFRWTSDDGSIAPALRGRSGIYTLRYAARGEGDAVVLASSARAMRVLIDGQVIVERRRDRPEPVTSRVAIHLSRGAHVIEVVVHALGRGDDSAVAVVDDRGRPALVPVVQLPERGAGVRARRLAGAVEALTTPRGAPDLAALDAMLWRAQLARARIGVDAADERVAADMLVEVFGYAPEALIFTASTLTSDEEIPRRQAWSFAEPLWERAAARAPASARARWALASVLRTQQPERGLEIVRDVAATFPAHSSVLRAWIADALEAGLLDEARGAAERLIAAARTQRNLDAAIPVFEALGDVRRAAELRRERDRLIRVPTSEASARDAQRLGDLDRALDELRRAAFAAPFSPALDSYVDALAPHDPKRALEIVEEALRVAPFDAQLARRRAALALHVSGAEEARVVLRASQRDLPTEGALERLGAELGMPARWRDRVGLGDQVIAARRSGPEPFPGHGAVFLLDDVERSLADDGSSHGLRHWVAELRTKEAIDRFGEIDVEDERVIILRVVKPNGRVVEPDIHPGVSDVSLPGLAPGDIVEFLSMSTSSASPFPRSGYETRKLDLMASPAITRRYSFDAPRELIARTGLVAIAENGMPTPTRTETVDDLGAQRVRYAFALESVAAARPEPFEPAREETARTAGFAYGVDAALWARARGRGLHLAATPTRWLTKCAQQIAGDGSDDEKLERLFAFVARRIEPGDASEASEVMASGQGQRTPLLLALARAAGLRVTPVSLHFPTQPPPSIVDSDAWSLVALAIELPERTAIAVVDRLVVLDALPIAARGAQLLDISLPRIARDDARIRPLPDSAVADDGVRVRVDLRRPPNAAGSAVASLVGSVRVDVPAAFADGMRRDVRKIPPDVAKSWVEQALQASFPGLVVEQVQFPNLDAAGAPLFFEADVRQALAPLANGTVRFEHLFSHGAGAAFSLGAPLPAALSVAERTRPMLLSADRESLEVRLALGEGAAFLEAPEALEQHAGPVALTQSAEVTDGTLTWRRTLRWDTTRISPADWVTLRPALAELVARLDARAAFVLGAAPVAAAGQTPSDL